MNSQSSPSKILLPLALLFLTLACAASAESRHAEAPSLASGRTRPTASEKSRPDNISVSYKFAEHFDSRAKEIPGILSMTLSVQGMGTIGVLTLAPPIAWAFARNLLLTLATLGDGGLAAVHQMVQDELTRQVAVGGKRVNVHLTSTNGAILNVESGFAKIAFVTGDGIKREWEGGVLAHHKEKVRDYFLFEKNDPEQLRELKKNLAERTNGVIFVRIPDRAITEAKRFYDRRTGADKAPGKSSGAPSDLYIAVKSPVSDPTLQWFIKFLTEGGDKMLFPYLKRAK